MNQAEIETLVNQLASKDGAVRAKAREQLVAAGGHEVTRAIVAQLTDPRRQVRWEAAKALEAIGDPISALPLVHAMEDDEKDVRWVAAEGIAGLGEVGLMALLSGLTRTRHASNFCEVAHLALRDLKTRGIHGSVIGPVMEAIEGPEPTLSAPVAAYEALQKLRSGE